MPFSIPIRSRSLDDLLTAIELYFDDKYQADDDNWPSGKFLVRGGVCWPERYDQATDSVRGCVVLLAYNLQTDVAYLFEEQGFSCVDHITDPKTRGILFPGIAPWFIATFARYLGDTFYVNQPDEVRDRWEMEVRRSPVLSERPPRFVPCPEWGDIGRGEGLLWEWITRRRLRMFAGGEVDGAIKVYRRGDEKWLPPQLHSVACALSGISGQIEGARDVARNPQTFVKVQNRMMIDNPKDWRGNT
jgi:hypothetical protein